MKGISNITQSKYKLFANEKYEVLEKFVENDKEFYKFKTGDGTLYVLSVDLMIPIYEVGDMVKIVKAISNKSGITGKEEVNNITYIDRVIEYDDGFPYCLSHQEYRRCADELEIVKTKYELEQEKKNKKIKFAISDVADVTLKNNNIEAKTYEKGDTLKIIEGKLKDIEGTFIDYIESYDKVLIQIDDETKLSVNSTNVMLSRKKVNNIHKDEKYDDIIYDLDLFAHPIEVRIHKNHTYVTLSDGTKSRTSCHPNDGFSEKDGVLKAFYRAMIKRYTKALEELLNKEN